MDRTVEGYLAQLRQQLAGSDPALAQDALYDAEEYLRSALGEAKGEPAEAFEAVVEAYGTPEEIAASYRGAELTVRAALKPPAPRSNRSPLSRFFGIAADPAAWGALFYMFLALATGIAYFTIVVTGLSLTAGLLVLIIGIPFALLFLAVVRAISFAEGRIVEGLLGVRMPRRPRNVGVQGDLWTRVKSWFTDYRTWTTMLYMLLQLPLGVIYFTVLVTGLATSVATILLPAIQEVADSPVIRIGEYGYLIDAWAYPLVVVLGVLGLVVMLWVARGIGYMHGAYAKAMLVGTIEQGQQWAAEAAQSQSSGSSQGTAGGTSGGGY